MSLATYYVAWTLLNISFLLGRLLLPIILCFIKSVGECMRKCVTYLNTRTNIPCIRTSTRRVFLIALHNIPISLSLIAASCSWHCRWNGRHCRGGSNTKEAHYIAFLFSVTFRNRSSIAFCVANVPLINSAMKFRVFIRYLCICVDDKIK